MQPVAEAAPAAAVETPLELTRRLAAEHRAAAGVTASPSAGAPSEFEAARAARQAASSVAPAAGNGWPDQKALNEAAIALRRAAYQAKQAGAAAEPIVAASGKMQLTGPEFTAFQKLAQSGVPLPKALEAIKGMRALSGAGTMTDAEVAAEIAARVGNRSPVRP
jgi:hypothetical protein